MCVWTVGFRCFQKAEAEWMMDELHITLVVFLKMSFPSDGCLFMLSSSSQQVSDTKSASCCIRGSCLEEME